MEGTAITLSDEFWDEFLLTAKMLYLKNSESTVYDVFNFIREHSLGGWTLLEDSKFIRDIDASVESEYQREVRKGKWPRQIP